MSTSKELSIQTISRLNKNTSELVIDIFWDEHVPACSMDMALTELPNTLEATFASVDGFVNMKTANSGDLVVITKENKIDYYINELGELIVRGDEAEIEVLSIDDNGDLIHDYCNEGFMIATGGNITEIDDYRIHSFPVAGTYDFIVTKRGSTGIVERLIQAAGASGGSPTPGASAGGGGGGGEIYGLDTIPSAGTYPVLVGAKGVAPPPSVDEDAASTQGGNSSFNGFVALGGGKAAAGNNTEAFNGGCGGGGCYTQSGGLGTPGQGYNGGGYIGHDHGSGGGGIDGVGQTQSSSVPGAGGPGKLRDIDGTPRYRGAGGGGGSYNNDNPGLGGTGGGGEGGRSSSPLGKNATTPGSGGGGGFQNNKGGDGADGEVIIKYKFR
jgi:hypothetical protein